MAVSTPKYKCLLTLTLLVMLAMPVCAGVEPALDWGGVTTSCFGGGAGVAAAPLLVEEAGAETAAVLLKVSSVA